MAKNELTIEEILLAYKLGKITIEEASLVLRAKRGEPKELVRNGYLIVTKKREVIGAANSGDMLPIFYYHQNALRKCKDQFHKVIKVSIFKSN